MPDLPVLKHLQLKSQRFSSADQNWAKRRMNTGVAFIRWSEKRLWMNVNVTVCAGCVYVHHIYFIRSMLNVREVWEYCPQINYQLWVTHNFRLYMKRALVALTVASSSNFPKSSLSSLTSSWAVHWEAKLVKPTMSANRMLSEERKGLIIIF